MSNPDFEGDVSSQVVIWTYGGGLGNAPEITINIGGETHGPVDIAGWTVINTWRSNTFTPDADDWTEIEGSTLKVSLTADVPTKLFTHTIFTVYALFTYPDPPVGWAHDFLGVPAANIGEINGIPVEDIESVKGVS